MRTRHLTFGLYSDEQGVAWVRRLVEGAVASRSARITGSELTTTAAYDFLVRQWAVEHPSQNSGARQLIKLRVHLKCSLRTRRAIRKAVITSLCPEGTAPHSCRVPWMAAA
ncbi:hypothetical protein [Streptomyces sp. NPDC056013]|uniref:hypothetical protein n=1 Tax=Streptomyces sp. NPDC056013 TaxID=3345680 RepID=UPI0035E102C9